jgi:Predicted signal-transduction protein containing cAMP-binding and CBS domains
MKCPFCGFKNLEGDDNCEKCGEDLAALDGVHPHDRLEKSMDRDSLRVFKLSPPILVAPDTPLQTVVEKLAQENRCVLVMERERLVGIVTERDVLFKTAELKKDLSKIPVSQIMTRDPVTLAPSDRIAYAVNKMSIGGYRHIPLVENGRPLGVVNVRDIVAYLAEMFPGLTGIHR